MERWDGGWGGGEEGGRRGRRGGGEGGGGEEREEGGRGGGGEEGREGPCLKSAHEAYRASESGPRARRGSVPAANASTEERVVGRAGSSRGFGGPTAGAGFCVKMGGVDFERTRSVPPPPPPPPPPPTALPPIRLSGQEPTRRAGFRPVSDTNERTLSRQGCRRWPFRSGAFQGFQSCIEQELPTRVRRIIAATHQTHSLLPSQRSTPTQQSSSARPVIQCPRSVQRSGREREERSAFPARSIEKRRIPTDR